jgi:hypothetical protein
LAQPFENHSFGSEKTFAEKPFWFPEKMQFFWRDDFVILLAPSS